MQAAVQDKEMTYKRKYSSHFFLEVSSLQELLSEKEIKHIYVYTCIYWSCLGLPSFHLGEVDGDEPVGQSFLIQIATVAPDKGGHVVAWRREWVSEKETRWEKPGGGGWDHTWLRLCSLQKRWTGTYLAVHLYRGSCSGWRECFSRPGTEWNAAETEKKSDRDYNQCFGWGTGAHDGAALYSREIVEVHCLRGGNSLHWLKWAETDASAWRAQTLAISSGWQTSLLPLLPPSEADGAEAGKGVLEIPVKGIVQCCTLRSAQTW